MDKGRQHFLDLIHDVLDCEDVADFTMYSMDDLWTIALYCSGVGAYIDREFERRRKLRSADLQQPTSQG